MTYTMLPLRLREALIGGILLSVVHLYTCLRFTAIEDEAVEELHWEEVSGGHMILYNCGLRFGEFLWPEWASMICVLIAV